jgi:uncharacterized membrane protein YidH (DUF202 family)
MPDTGRQPFDGAGLQNERTSLAWVRTSLSLIGLGLFVAKQSGSMKVAVPLIVAVVAVAAWAITATEAQHHERHRALRAGDPVVALHHVSVMTAAALTLAVCSLLIVVT